MDSFELEAMCGREWREAELQNKQLLDLMMDSECHARKSLKGAHLCILERDHSYRE